LKLPVEDAPVCDDDDRVKNASVLKVMEGRQPVGQIAPTLLRWRQQYSCRPAE